MSDELAEQVLEVLARDPVVVPDVGDCFTVDPEADGYGLLLGDNRYGWRVASWLKRWTPPTMEQRVADFPEHVREDMAAMFAEWDKTHVCRGAGPDRVPLVWCYRHEAEYVSGHGVCGIIARVADVRVDRHLENQHIADERKLANMFAANEERLV